MKYVNANNVLPEELIPTIKKYYQGGYLYIPKENNYCEVKQQTSYKVGLEKRHQYIYLKHLEGRANKQLGNIYYLSEPGIRRIILKEKERYQKVEAVIKQILPVLKIQNVPLMHIMCFILYKIVKVILTKFYYNNL